MTTVPRRKRYKRAQRLQTAKSWLGTYEGKNIAQGYRKHYGVGWKTTFIELEILGVEISPVYKDAVLRSVEAHILACQEKSALKKASQAQLLNDDQDTNFAFIAGYTSWGFPYGLTWEEMDALEQIDNTILEVRQPMNPIPEPDWKILAKLKSVALDRLCSRILKKAADIAGTVEKESTHDCYLRLYRYIETSDEIIERSFGEWSRSTALITLANWRKEHLLTDDEFSAFSEATRASVDLILSL